VACIAIRRPITAQQASHVSPEVDATEMAFRAIAKRGPENILHSIARQVIEEAADIEADREEGVRVEWLSGYKIVQMINELLPALSIGHEHPLSFWRRLAFQYFLIDLVSE
jgi:hypothetical protein